MPIISPHSKVLVTGANGFISAWVINTLLERGHSVRGAVRSDVKGVHLKKIFEKYGDKFEIVIVPDIAREGAFDQAVKGVDAVEHIASPVTMTSSDPQDLIVPALKGTLGVLQSALKYGPTIKRIVITSSLATLMRLSATPLKFTESDWNEESIKEVEEKGKDSSPMDQYKASKTLAERAAWDFYAEHKDSVGWDLVVIHPPWVFGPVLHEAPNFESLNASMLEWGKVILLPDSGEKTLEDLATQGTSWVDVRDLAEAHVRSLEREEAGGQRFFVSSEAFKWQDWIDAANSLSPSPIPSHPSLPKGNPGAGANAVNMFEFDHSKAVRILGLTFRTKEETTRDVLADFEKRGW